ncbi:DUF2059 domain-containing protein [Pseudoxanthomonas sangjuensis]|uniref:DUF2059 domain-containing protein n=1 Tax=Pseudoxanthomonas sangjuensis TaxID=1503750 RepID=UPI001FE7100D|nr:DUF2059 domain-containing protein [Pseudoxanthomonas sangjuensis]
MRLRFLVPVLYVVLALPAIAAEPSEADIERLLRATRAESMLVAIQPQIETVQRQQFEQITAGKELSEAQKAEVADIQARTSEIVRKTLAWEEMKPLYIEVYRRNFDRDDVRAIAKFYESKAGQRMLDRNPVLMQELMAAIQQKMLPMLQQMETELKAASVERIEAPPVSPPQKRRPAPAPAKKKKKKR